MWWQLFTPAFRARLRFLAANATGREARVLAAKISPLLSASVVLALLFLLPGYGYAALSLLVLGVAGAGAVLAYLVPLPFILLLRFVAADPKEVVLWARRRKQGSRDES